MSYQSQYVDFYIKALYDLILEKGYQDNVFGLPVIPTGRLTVGRIHSFLFAFERGGKKQVGLGSHHCSLQHIKANKVSNLGARDWLKTQITTEELALLDLQHELQE